MSSRTRPCQYCGVEFAKYRLELRTNEVSESCSTCADCMSNFLIRGITVVTDFESFVWDGAAGDFRPTTADDEPEFNALYQRSVRLCAERR